MALDANSYGSVAGVAAYVPWSASAAGTFDATTKPTLSIVESWIDQLSAAVNLELENYGYSVPATGNLNSWLDGWVNQEVSDQIRAVNQRTQRGPNRDEGQQPGTRTLTGNIGEVREMLKSLARGDTRKAGSKAVTRADAYSSTYSTTDVDT